jgi:hypothetical protein
MDAARMTGERILRDALLEASMKLVNKKTRKAINKAVRKAMKKNGPALMAGLAGAFASSLATLAKTDAPGKGGKSNLADLVDRVQHTVAGDDTKSEGAEKKAPRPGGAGALVSAERTADHSPTGLSGLIHSSKDAALAFAAERFINARLRAIGEVTRLSLNTSDHTAHLRLTLHGESEPVDIGFSNVAVERAKNGALVTVGHAVASREWLSGALSEFVVGCAFPISRHAGLVLRLMT